MNWIGGRERGELREGGRRRERDGEEEEKEREGRKKKTEKYTKELIVKACKKGYAITSLHQCRSCERGRCWRRGARMGLWASGEVR